jgi:hypothetical protein
MSIYEIPDSVTDLFEQCENSYRIIDYEIPGMNNIESLEYFLNQIGATNGDIYEGGSTQVVLTHPDFDYMLVIDSGGLGDFYSHRYDVSLYEA